MRHLSVTGTRQGTTDVQHSRLSDIIALCRVRGFGVFHDGDCVGVDVQAVEIAFAHGYHCVGHPSTASTRAYFIGRHEMRGPMSPLERNRVMVDECDLLVACPKEFNEIMRSGTWATIRYAKKIGRKIIFAYPDGSVGQWRPADGEATTRVHDSEETGATRQVQPRTATVSRISPRRQPTGMLRPLNGQEIGG